MGVLERPTKQRIILSTITYGLVIPAVLFFALLFLQASQLGQSAGTSSVFVSAGPLQLMQLDKTALPSGGTQASLQFLPGLLAFFAIGMAVSIAVALYRSKDLANEIGRASCRERV